MGITSQKAGCKPLLRLVLVLQLLLSTAHLAHACPTLPLSLPLILLPLSLPPLRCRPPAGRQGAGQLGALPEQEGGKALHQL